MSLISCMVNITVSGYLVVDFVSVYIYKHIMILDMN